LKRPAAAVLTLAALLAAPLLYASIENLKEFQTRYPDAKAKLGKCSTCHVKSLPKKEDHEHNPFGKDVAKTLIDPKASPKVHDWAKVEPLDSDGDGIKNIDEIKAGTNPGDPKSK